ncbi:hypothetical protein [Dactylosporangium sp. NPDC049140]|uniref:hypothetical protein n=1 Tax=Dactylosporangium sp. NPDC049140 TaxID=3155647 RepID=UPI00340C0280
MSDGMFLEAALRRRAEAGRVPPERLRLLPGRLFAALWLAAVLLLAGLGAALLATADGAVPR